MATAGTQYQQKASNTSLRCIQINLKHSKTATDNFNQLTKETDIDMAFIQEPYISQNQVTEISRNYKVFTCGSGRKRAAVVVVNKMIDALLIVQLSEEV
jgi:hypothetical protein